MINLERYPPLHQLITGHFAALLRTTFITKYPYLNNEDHRHQPSTAKTSPSCNNPSRSSNQRKWGYECSSTTCSNHHWCSCLLYYCFGVQISRCFIRGHIDFFRILTLVILFPTEHQGHQYHNGYWWGMVATLSPVPTRMIYRFGKAKGKWHFRKQYVTLAWWWLARYYWGIGESTWKGTGEWVPTHRYMGKSRLSFELSNSPHLHYPTCTKKTYLRINSLN